MNAQLLHMANYPAGCILSIIVPVFNEAAVLAEFHQRLSKVLIKIPLDYELVFIDDGSTDETWSMLRRLHAIDPAVAIARFSRNFGKEQALTAGLHLAHGEAVIILDADLQDPPEEIPRMLKEWRAGADIVNMRRSSRPGESWFKRSSAHLFYRTINAISESPIPVDVGDFRLLSRRAVDALNQLGESNRFMKGLFGWIGFPQTTLTYARHPRLAGQSKWPYWKLWNLALEGITGFSTAPLKVASYAGLASALGAFAYAAYFLLKTLLLGDSVPGFPTLIVSVLLLGGMQLMAIGVLGEYLGRLFKESKRRPLYLIEHYAPAVGAASEQLPRPRAVKA
ncbi:MAG: glycosyltransferase family 2 protein [Burkholderiaceae bacterium]